MGEEMHIVLNVDAKYHRDQFDDWLAGGDVYYRRRRYYWCAQNSNYGVGWEIEPITEEDWNNLPEYECNKIFKLIEQSLDRHRTGYVF